MSRIAVFGAGAWGTGLAIRLAANHPVTLWGRDPAQLSAMQAQRSNAAYLPNCPFPESLSISGDFAATARAAEILISAVPSTALRALASDLNQLKLTAPLLSLSKGYVQIGEQISCPHQGLAEVWAGEYAVLTGPSFASEVARGLPVALVLASRDKARAQDLANQLTDKAMRIYASDDVIGAEIGGAFKNSIAIAAGISDGLALGDNARAALITRGLAEMARLVAALGGQQETVFGLAGMGDLMLTCAGGASRNRRVGLGLAEGKSLAEVLQQLGHVAEGVTATPLSLALAHSQQVELPIVAAVNRVLIGEISAADAMRHLLSRRPNSEHRAK
jgi:glycerol-3-phosphate dehydrogenase (NAD(P)+)